MGLSSDSPLVANQLSDQDYPDDFDAFKELFDREIKKYIDSINSKVGGLYYPTETATFKKYFTETDPQNFRNVYRRLINFGPLPNATTKRVPHNILFNSVARLTQLYGAATNPSSGSMIPLPFASPVLANNISLEANETDIIITTGSNRSSYRDTTVIIEYTKG